MVAVTAHSDFGAQEHGGLYSVQHESFTFPPSICHEVMGLAAMILSFLNAEFQISFFTFLFHAHQEAF